ncbi:hypothetical protein [Tessaracoccus sp. G1721]
MSLNTWAHTVSQCDELLGGADPAIRRAAGVRSLVVVEPLQLRRTALREVGLDVLPGTPPNQRERQELRAVALYVTRAASRRAEGASKLVLVGVERSLLEATPPIRTFEAGLNEWRLTLASTIDTIDPSAALVVSRTQYSLLSAGATAMKGLEVADGVGHERLLVALEASRMQWLRAYEVWKEMLPRQTAPTDDLRKAMLALQLTATQSSEADKLRGLLATGFGGNLAAALAVTPADMRAESDLVAAAVTLEQRSDLAAVVQPRRVSDPEPPGRPPMGPGVGPAVQFTADTSPTQRVAEPRSASPDPERPRIEDHVALVELAGQRDAGVIAAAARSGVAEAQALTAGASPGELDALVERGRLARAAIVASGVAAAKHWSRKIPPDQVHARDEYVAEASLRMAEIVDSWDPRRASWGSFAFQHAGYAFWDRNRRRAQSREVVSDRIGDFASGLDRVVGPVSVPPEDVVLLGQERERVAQLVEGLPGRLREVMAGRLGLAGEPKTLAAVGEETGSSVSTTHRDAREGTRLLAARYLGQEHQPSSTSRSAAPGPVTLRLLAQVLQSGEGPVGESVAVRPEHRGGRPAPGVRGVSR